ncbi:MAG: acetyl-CoA carboxylase carboxyltransferase subunit beta [Verrucomicrobia bacterium]|nr:acetyl-CoA carboxylase carboxyltransferase subunit beta [Verrucomicrobiota bacterium]MBS0636294.1 acetyl-CoA carboxylase carboxyltransferase subunit beta [Verrucomicrobiota bacterium]
MGLFSRNKTKIKITSTKKDGFSGWLKCTHCSELIHANELEGNNNCCPKCNYHYRLSADDRINLLADSDTFCELFQGLEAVDALDFRDGVPYSQRLEGAKKKSGREEACVVGTCQIHGIQVALGVMDFGFMGGSMGSVVGEKLTRLIEHATAKRLPLIIVSISGGARMQESIFSLMQMAKTSAALARLQERKVPYISVLTNPTTGGVTASFASLGDIIIAEPNALICFAGPRVIEQILGKPLPEGAQQSEFLLKHGLIDIIAPRHELKNTLGNILDYVSVSFWRKSA